jgi:thiosulfate/3-mercaptopyruvate sulfurtransferase
VVVYDQDSGMFASRLWWELRWLGHDAVAVLDGGFIRWLADGRPISEDVEQPRPRAFVARPRPYMIATMSDVAAAVGQGDQILVDARAPARFSGTVETLDHAAGHIPGAVNHFFQTNLSEAGTFRSVAELREGFQNAVGDNPPDRIISYCGSGVTACQNLLAMEHAGLRGGRLYPGSWSEWSSDPARPVARKE